MDDLIKRLSKLADEMNEISDIIGKLPTEERPSDDLLDVVDYIRESSHDLCAASNLYLEG